MEDDDSGAWLEISRDTENKKRARSPFFDGMVTLPPGPTFLAVSTHSRRGNQIIREHFCQPLGAGKEVNPFLIKR